MCHLPPHSSLSGGFLHPFSRSGDWDVEAPSGQSWATNWVLHVAGGCGIEQLRQGRVISPSGPVGWGIPIGLPTIFVKRADKEPQGAISAKGMG